MNDARDRAEGRAGRFDAAPHIGLVADIARHIERLVPEFTEPVRDAVVQRRSSHQDHPGPAFMHQIAGEDQTQSTESAGDQVDAVLPDRDAGGRLRFERTEGTNLPDTIHVAHFDFVVRQHRFGALHSKVGDWNRKVYGSW